MFFKQFFDEKLAQYSYLAGCRQTGEAVVIDPLRDTEPYIIAAAKENLILTAAAETHIHADYISGLREFAERNLKIYASGEGDGEWSYEWLPGSRYNHVLMKDGEEFKIGNITLKALHTPGHTPEHLSYLIADGRTGEEPFGLITGDFIFVGDVGRPDILEPAADRSGIMESPARVLYRSIKKFENLPDYLQIWPGHGEGSACGKSIGARPASSAGYELKYNRSVKAATDEESFVEFILEDQPEPPLYFSRVKHANKEGPPLLAGLPGPGRLTTEEIGLLPGKRDTVVLDTRPRDLFVSGHIQGSLLSPADRQFNTIAGSYLDGSEKIILVAEEHQVREAVTDLIRVGLNPTGGYITQADLRLYSERGGKLETMETAGFDAIGDYENNGKPYAVLDVRKASEYGKSHVPGAVNLAHIRLPEHMDEVPKGKKLLVHCRSGRRSAVASALLKRNGFDVTLIDDHFENYEKKGEPV